MAWTDKCNFKFPETWEEWEKTIQKPVLNPYGLPEITEGTITEYGPTRGIEVQPRWEVPRKIVVSSTITGGFYSKRQNPNHPITVDEIRNSAEECIRAGSPTVHIHVRDDAGLPTYDVKRYHAVIDPLKEKYPNVVFDGCCVWGPTHREGLKLVEDGLLEITPVNTTAVYCGDTLVALPPSWLMAKTEYLQRHNCKPQIAVYTTGDIDNANRYLIKTGILEKPYYWIILPNLPGGTPMPNAKAMVNGLEFFMERIKEIDPESIIMVCSSGRAGSYLAAAAVLLGAHAIRMGMEDTIWQYPHRDDRITSNAEAFRRGKQLVELLGLECATSDEYRKLVGIK